MKATQTLFNDLKRSWSQHLGVQLSTLAVLTATFTVIFSIMSLLTNMKDILSRWGNDIQVTVFLEEDLGSEQLSKVRSALQEVGEFKSVQYITKEDAKTKFLNQMPGFAKDVIEDPEFSNPFPASFQVGGLTGQEIARLPDLAKKIADIAGVEDVSYGQEWVENYAGFLNRVGQAGGVILLTLVLGSLFVIANSIRVAISQRKEEIEIQELVGATSQMIRKPFLFEGGVMGGTAAVLGIVLSYAVYWLEMRVLKTEMNLLSINEVASFFGFWSCLVLIAFGASSGILGAWLCVRKLNSGWAASREAQ